VQALARLRLSFGLGVSASNKYLLAFQLISVSSLLCHQF